MSHLALSQAYLTLTLLMKKMKFFSPQSPKQALFFPCVLPYCPSNKSEGAIRVAVPAGERWGPPSARSKHGDKIFQSLAPDSAAPHSDGPSVGVLFQVKGQECRDGPEKELLHGPSLPSNHLKPTAPCLVKSLREMVFRVFIRLSQMRSHSEYLYTQTLRLIQGSLTQGQRELDG